MTEFGTETRPTSASGLTPPQALQAERAVLAAMMLGNESVGRAIESIGDRPFYRTAHQKIFDAIVALYNRSEPADLITVSEELRRRNDFEAIGGAAYLAGVFEEATTAANLEVHAKIVSEKAVLRQLIKATTEIQQECYAAGDDVAAIVNRSEERIFQISDKSVRKGLRPIKDMLTGSFEEIQALFDRKQRITGVPSGFVDLDRVTLGFQPGDLIIIAGRPAMGKSSLAVNIAENAAIKHKVTVGLFSLEMSSAQLMLRMLGSQSEVALHKLRSGFLGNEDWPRLTAGGGLLRDAPIWIDDSAAPTVLELRAKCRRLKAEANLGLVVIDYLQMIQGIGRAENRVQEVSQITRALKAMAKELAVPIIALSQLSRGVEQRGGNDKRPQLSDLRDSGCLTADARVLRADTGAEVSMGELLASGEKNIPVWTIDESFRLVQGNMTHVFPSGVKEVFEMRLASGRSISASANHPFLTLDGWRRLDQLAVGERLAVPRRSPDPLDESGWAESELVMLAHMIGDGCMAPRQPIHYTSADEANLTAVEIAAGHFGITPRRVPQETWCHVYLPAPFRLARGRHNPLVAWLDGLGLYGKRSYEKFVPEGVFALPLEQLALFLRHLWATDGCVHPAKAQSRIYYASTSLRLAEDVRQLLLRFGIQSRCKVTQKGEYRPCYQLHITGRENQVRFLRDIGVHGARSAKVDAALNLLAAIQENTNLDTVPVGIWNRVRTSMVERGVTTRGLQASVGKAYCGSTFYKHAPSRERMMRVAAVVVDPELHLLAESDLFWDAVVTIAPLGPQPVFDATVLGTHNFIANGIVTHNSIEQDSDLVIFVYREEYYKPDDPSVQGKAEIIVGKHRNGPTGTVELTFIRDQTKFVDHAVVMPGETDSGF